MLQFTSVPSLEKPAGPSPAVVLLHDLGANERSLLWVTERLDARFSVIGLRAPLTLGPNAFGWFHAVFSNPAGVVHDPAEAAVARDELAAFLRSLEHHHDIDSTQLYLLGFGQGATLALSVALTEPTLMKGVVSIAGRTLPELTPGVSKVWPKVLQLHGSRDKRMPFQGAGKSHAVLMGSGLPTELKIYDAEHEVLPAMMNDARAWLGLQLPAVTAPEPTSL